MREIQWTKTLNSGNLQINFLQHQGIVTHLHRLHFQAPPSSNTIPLLLWNQAHNPALVQLKDMRVMCRRDKNTIAPKVAMVDVKCPPLRNSPSRGHHLHVHHECLQRFLETSLTLGRPLPVPLQADNFPVLLGDAPSASQRNHFSLQRNHTGHIWQGLRTCRHYLRFLMMNSMQIMWGIIRRTWAGQKAKPQSAWSKRNPPWSHYPKGRASPTLVQSTCERKNKWLGFSRRRISALSRDRTIWNRSEMEPCTGWLRWQIFWRLLRSGCHWKTSIMPKGFSGNGLRCL